MAKKNKLVLGNSAIEKAVKTSDEDIEAIAQKMEAKKDDKTNNTEEKQQKPSRPRVKAEVVPFSINLPKALYTKISERAKERGQTKKNVIVDLLWKGLE